MGPDPWISETADTDTGVISTAICIGHMKLPCMLGGFSSVLSLLVGRDALRFWIEVPPRRCWDLLYKGRCSRSAAALPPQQSPRYTEAFLEGRSTLPLTAPQQTLHSCPF